MPRQIQGHPPTDKEAGSKTAYPELPETHMLPPFLARKLSAKVATARRKINQARGMKKEM
jgi:hypothetical protein